MIWERNSDAFYTNVETPSGEIRFHLAVELLPDGSWDWIVWRPGNSYTVAHHGVADSAQAAMRAAEAAIEEPD